MHLPEGTKQRGKEADTCSEPPVQVKPHKSRPSARPLCALTLTRALDHAHRLGDPPWVTLLYRLPSKAPAPSHHGCRGSEEAQGSGEPGGAGGAE